MGDNVSIKKKSFVRSLASMALLCAGVWLMISGISLHFATREGITTLCHLFMAMHNTSALIFIIAAVIHTTTNRNVLANYIKTGAGELMKFRREFLMTVISVSAVVLLVASHVFHRS